MTTAGPDKTNEVAWADVWSALECDSVASLTEFGLIDGWSMNKEAERSFRRVVWLATLGGVAFIMLPILLFWYRLPDNMVMRWDVHGDPAWAVPKLIHLSTYVGMYLFGALIALRQRENATGPLMMLTCMGGVLGLVTWYGAYAQLDTTRWQDAAKLRPTTLAGLLLLPIAAMLVVGRIAKHRWPTPPADNAPAAESHTIQSQPEPEADD